MKILNDATSPFGRKVVVCALERGVGFEEHFVDIADIHGLRDVSPQLQIPIAISDSGVAYYDSPVIVSFLDSLHSSEPLVRNLEDFRQMALYDGLMEAVLARRIEICRPEASRSQAVLDRQQARIENCLKVMSDALPQIPATDVGGPVIALACALAYTEFRYSADWRVAYPEMGAWLEKFAQRPSMQATAPTRTRPLQ